MPKRVMVGLRPAVDKRLVAKAKLLGKGGIGGIINAACSWAVKDKTRIKELIGSAKKRRLGRPSDCGRGHFIYHNISMNDEIVELIKKAADASPASRSALIEHILEEYWRHGH